MSRCLVHVLNGIHYCMSFVYIRLFPVFSTVLVSRVTVQPLK